MEAERARLHASRKVIAVATCSSRCRCLIIQAAERARQAMAQSAVASPQLIPTGNQMEDAFEQMALLMNNAFRLANAPAFPALSLTPIAIYRDAPAGPPQ